MSRKAINTPSGDRKRDRAARAARAARDIKPLEGNRIRVRSKRLDQVDEAKLSLAFWLLAKQLVEDQTDPGVSDASATDGPAVSTDEVAR
jgi:hypothetical protein